MRSVIREILWESKVNEGFFDKFKFGKGKQKNDPEDIAAKLKKPFTYLDVAFAFDNQDVKAFKRDYASKVKNFKVKDFSKLSNISDAITFRVDDLKVWTDILNNIGVYQIHKGDFEWDVDKKKVIAVSTLSYAPGWQAELNKIV